MTPNIQIIQGGKAAAKRGMRKPQHSFNIVQRPWAITPFHFQPVLAGETLKSMQVISRTVSDPLKDKLMGYWSEKYFFYVKHRDLPIRNELTEMHLDQLYDTTALRTATARPANFFAGNGIDYVQHCLNEVVKWYFRDEDQSVMDAAIDGLPLAHINMDGWWESMKKLLKFLLMTMNWLVTSQFCLSAFLQEWKASTRNGEHMRAAKLTEATFEDYLASHGIKADKDLQEELHKPELLRYMKEFTYPTNTVEPTTGVPSSAAVWSQSDTLDKDRFFKEPGFIIGVSVIRPKVHFSNIKGTLTSFLDKAYDWLPAIIADHTYSSVKGFPNGSGPARGDYGEDYWVDLRDLFLYGESFRNHETINNVNLPRDTSADVDYATAAEADALFIIPANNVFRSDGIVTSQIASTVYKDYT